MHYNSLSGQAPRDFDPTAETRDDEEEYEHGRVLYRAVFSAQSQAAYVSYATWSYAFLCLALTFAYGIGILMILYTPVVRHIAKRDIATRRLFITTESIVYKTRPPCCVPSCGVNKREKHVLLPLVTDVVLSQSWLEAKFGVWSVNVENAGQGGQADAKGGRFDLSTRGIEDPKLFKRVCLMAATARRTGVALTEDLVQRTIREGSEAAMAGISAHGPGAVGGPGPQQLMLLGGSAPAHADAAAVASPHAASKLDEISGTLLRIAELLSRGDSAGTGNTTSEHSEELAPGVATDENV